MFSAPVTLHARSEDLSRRMLINVTISNEDSEAFFEVELLHDDSVVCIDYVPVCKSIIYVTTHEQKSPIYMLLHPKHSKLSVVNIQEKSVIFYSFYQPGHYVFIYKSLLTWVPLAEVSLEQKGNAK